MQFIGRLMRDVDPAPLEAALKRWSEGPAEEKARFAALERWRTRLLDEPTGLADFIAEHPAADRAELADLVHAARAERPDERAAASPARAVPGDPQGVGTGGGRADTADRTRPTTGPAGHRGRGRSMSHTRDVADEDAT